MSIVETAFNKKAANYAKGRPEYPEDILKFLAANSVSIGTKIADIGSGTGIFSKALLKLGAEVWGIEINQEMRAKAEENLAGNILFHSVSGAAENTNLPDASVDFISAAQAFHWFDKEKFRQEARRILKPDGKIILVWNCELMNNPFFSEWGKIQIKWINQKTTTNQNYSPQEYFINPAKEFFTNYLEYRCPNPTWNDKETFLARALSASAAPRPDEANYQGYLADISSLFDRFQQNGKLLYPCETVVLIGEV